ncbi:hypothetical protein B0H12DRAFT_1130505 [Mycena haematopus]|nr:hypothetical protein B0H12DRAFT_1130505 [Mycena haematopus]
MPSAPRRRASPFSTVTVAVALAGRRFGQYPDFTSYSQTPQGNPSSGRLALPYMRSDPVCRTFNSTAENHHGHRITSDFARFRERRNTFYISIGCLLSEHDVRARLQVHQLFNVSAVTRFVEYSWYLALFVHKDICSHHLPISFPLPPCLFIAKYAHSTMS